MRNFRAVVSGVLTCCCICLGSCETTWAQSGKKDGPDRNMSDKPFQSTASGLKYRILRQGDGTTKANNASSVTVHYKGWLPEGADGSQGKEFDSSYKRGEPISFPLSGVIKGWTEGMQLVSKGGMIELEIPPDLGYGARGAGGSIPPNATLRFIVELLEVK